MSRPKTFVWLAMVTALFSGLLSAGLFSAGVGLAAPPAAVAEPPMQKPVAVLATGVFAMALPSLASAYASEGGSQVQISIANAGEVAARVTAGEGADLVMSSMASVKALAAQGLLVADEVVIGRMRLGVAVRPGAAMPDLSSSETFKALLTSATTIAYIDPNGGGTSGPFFEKMLVSLGVADAVHAKAVLCKTGAEIVKAVASGRAAIGMTQASELVGADGVAFAGYLPEAQNLTTVYAAAITAASNNRNGAVSFLQFVTGPAGRDRLARAGWDVER